MADEQEQQVDPEVFFGETFPLPERMNERRIMQLYAAAQSNTDSDSPAGAALLDKLLYQLVNDSDRDRFDDVCDRERTSIEEVMEFVGRRIAARAARPTMPARDSAAGRSPTAVTSTPDSSPTAGTAPATVTDQAVQILAGRPDLQLMVMDQAAV